MTSKTSENPFGLNEETLSALDIIAAVTCELMACQVDSGIESAIYIDLAKHELKSVLVSFGVTHRGGTGSSPARSSTLLAIVDHKMPSVCDRLWSLGHILARSKMVEAYQVHKASSFLQLAAMKQIVIRKHTPQDH